VASATGPSLIARRRTASVPTSRAQPERRWRASQDVAFAPKQYSWLARILHARAGQPGQGERRESATDVRLDGDEVAADADDGDAGDVSRTYIAADSPMA
jgi:hypothetical protein